MWKYYTGFTYDIVHLIFEYVESSISLTSLTVLTKFNQLLLALIKLRLGLHFKDLAYRFKISRTTASSPGDVVLADRGFLIKETLAILQAKVIVPAFTKSKSQLHPLEIEETRNIAHVRIHVERITGMSHIAFKTHKLKAQCSKPKMKCSWKAALVFGGFNGWDSGVPLHFCSESPPVSEPPREGAHVSLSPPHIQQNWIMCGRPFVLGRYLGYQRDGFKEGYVKYVGRARPLAVVVLLCHVGDFALKSPMAIVCGKERIVTRSASSMVSEQDTTATSPCRSDLTAIATAPVF
ncbi:hypothetical protein NQ315_013536 [Exocentrus adspersus]|uniref:Transposase Helix-turn-helix domain-containing protein n=1 Tax=Exocentrus adspersus TaxID=1586481 RepID=A0AAV8VB07_9CUCU|nr:hypothetical protein NQ315_013536 [Exocentrus adspersus]